MKKHIILFEVSFILKNKQLSCPSAAIFRLSFFPVAAKATAWRTLMLQSFVETLLPDLREVGEGYGLASVKDRAA